MEKVKYYIEKYKYTLIIVFLVIIILIILAIKLNKNNESQIEKQEVSLENKEEVKKETKEEIKIRVDIKGLINKPGVYEMDSSSRVIDLINKAGGLKEGANTEYINLSKKLEDEMIIIIYSNDDVSKFKETDKNVIYIKYKCDCPDNINSACINESDKVNTNGVEAVKKEQTKDKNLISINTGTVEELMTISGLGESKAKAIIKYREENGEFKTIEDIKNVSGIGDALYSKIKDYIKV